MQNNNYSPTKLEQQYAEIFDKITNGFKHVYKNENPMSINYRLFQHAMYYTNRELALIFDKDVSTISKWKNSGYIKSICLSANNSGSIRYLIEDIKAFFVATQVSNHIANNL
jgi:hypothetical protein